MSLKLIISSLQIELNRPLMKSKTLLIDGLSGEAKKPQKDVEDVVG